MKHGLEREPDFFGIFMNLLCSRHKLPSDHLVQRLPKGLRNYASASLSRKNSAWTNFLGLKPGENWLEQFPEFPSPSTSACTGQS